MVAGEGEVAGDLTRRCTRRAGKYNVKSLDVQKVRHYKRSYRYAELMSNEKSVPDESGDIFHGARWVN